MDALKLIRRSPVVFMLAVLAAVAMLFISEGSYWQSASMLEQLAAERDARAQVLDLRKNILDVETGQRGYLLTGRAEFLAPRVVKRAGLLRRREPAAQVA